MSKEIGKLIKQLGKEFSVQKAKASKSYVILKLDPEEVPTSLRQTRLSLRRAMRATHFRAQRDMFPQHRRKQPVSFHMKNARTKSGVPVVIAVELIGTAEKPALRISGYEEE